MHQWMKLLMQSYRGLCIQSSQLEGGKIISLICHQRNNGTWSRELSAIQIALNNGVCQRTLQKVFIDHISVLLDNVNDTLFQTFL